MNISSDLYSNASSEIPDFRAKLDTFASNWRFIFSGSLTFIIICSAVLFTVTRLKRPIKIVLLNLLASDFVFLLSCTIQGVYLDLVQLRVSAGPLCFLSTFLLIYGIVLCHASLTVITLNTILVVFLPHKYNTLVRTKPVLLVVLSMWILLAALCVGCMAIEFPTTADVFCSPVISLHRYGFLILAILFFVCDASVISMNVILFNKMRIRDKARRSIHPTGPIRCSTMPENLRGRMGTVNATRQRERQPVQPIIPAVFDPSSPPHQNQPHTQSLNTLGVIDYNSHHISLGQQRDPNQQQKAETTELQPNRNIDVLKSEVVESSDESNNFKSVEVPGLNTSCEQTGSLPPSTVEMKVVNNYYCLHVPGRGTDSPHESCETTEWTNETTETNEVDLKLKDEHKSEENKDTVPVIKIEFTQNANQAGTSQSPTSPTLTHVQSARTNDESTSRNTTSNISDISSSFRNKTNNNQRSAPSASDGLRRLNKTFIILALWCSMLNMPFLCFMLYAGNVHLQRTQTIFSSFLKVTTASTLIKLIGDPVIYAWRHLDWKEMYRRIRAGW